MRYGQSITSPEQRRPISGRVVRRTSLSLLIAAALLAPTVNAQDDQAPPKLYTTVDEASIYIIEADGNQTDVQTGESVRLTEDGIEFVGQRPRFMDWPCGTTFAPDRGTLPGFSFDSLTPGDQIGQIASLYFTEQQVLDSEPNFLNGESHGALSADQIDQFVSNAFWYKTGPASPKMAASRPNTLLISLFYGTGQVVVDTNHLDSLKEFYGDDPIPTLFVYQEENVVPISYFGENPQPSQIIAASRDSGIRPADVPMIFAGDQHTAVNPGELATTLGVAPASEMDQARLNRILEDINTNGMTAKPVTLGLITGDDEIIIDTPERLRAAEIGGLSEVPVMFSVFENDMIARRCGLQPPVEAAGLLGTTEGEAPGFTPPDETDPGTGPEGPDQPPEPPGPGRPTPPEITPPNPPPPELPVSDN